MAEKDSQRDQGNGRVAQAEIVAQEMTASQPLSASPSSVTSGFLVAAANTFAAPGLPELKGSPARTGARTARQTGRSPAGSGGDGKNFDHGCRRGENGCCGLYMLALGRLRATQEKRAAGASAGQGTSNAGVRRRYVVRHWGRYPPGNRATVDVDPGEFEDAGFDKTGRVFGAERAGASTKPV